MTDAHGITRSIQERANLIDAQPVISAEQAAADKAAFRQMCNDPGYRMTNWERAASGKEPRRRERGKPSGPIARTAESLVRAQDLRAAGWTDNRIVAELGISHHTIRRHLGPATNVKSKRLAPDERSEKQRQAVYLRGKGWSYRMIAEELGLSQEGVRAWIVGGSQRVAA